MTGPTFDANGYPTEETLEAVRNWDSHDFPALMEFVAKAWKWGTFRKGKPKCSEDDLDTGGDYWTAVTGGWSGNEDLIGALSENTIFWYMCWRMEMRGGYYEFYVKGTNDRTFPRTFPRTMNNMHGGRT